MAWSPLMAGDGRPSHHTFTTDRGIFSLFSLQNSAIAMHLEDVNNNNQLYICTGTWAITGDGSAGKADFTPSSADLLPANPLGRPGLYKAYPVVTLGSGPVAMDSQLLSVIGEP